MHCTGGIYLATYLYRLICSVGEAVHPRYTLNDQRVGLDTHIQEEATMTERTVGRTVRGIRAPMIHQGDDIVKIAVQSILRAAEQERFSLNDKDIIAITESVVARSQGNYVCVDDIAEEVTRKLGDRVGVVHPILSRNRFARILKGIARNRKEVILMLSYPSDEVGNPIMDPLEMEKLGINLHKDTLTEEEYVERFGHFLHPFTGVDYLQFYKEIILQEGAKPTIVFSNDVAAIRGMAPAVLVASIHNNEQVKRTIISAGKENDDPIAVLDLGELCNEPRPTKGYNPSFGLYGSNVADEAEMLKLFPRPFNEAGDRYVVLIQEGIRAAAGKQVEALIYGDGCFKDPVAGIWELADKVVAPDYTDGLVGTPNELKMKYLLDSKHKAHRGQEAERAIREEILQKEHDLKGKMSSEGTTPRRLTDLIGSLCDLVSGSGDQGTPIVLIQGYFDNYASLDR